MNKRYILGVDLGATNIKLGLLDRDRIILKQILPTKYFSSREELLSGLSQNLSRLLEKRKVSPKDVLGLGIGAPGPVDSRKGIVHYFPNIKGWRNVPLKQIMQKRSGFPVFVDNDANLMCLAETRVGAARGKRNVVAITLGTGVGGGIVIEGQLYRGASLAAGEIGHIPLSESGPKCNCGGIACLERYIGNRYILEKAVALFGRGISLEKLTVLADQGNLKALGIWQEMAGHLGICLSGIINFLNPEAVVIGGGLSGAGRLILDTVRKVIKRRAMPPQVRAVKILKARLGNNAGILGAALMVKERLLAKAIFLLEIFVFLNFYSLSFCAVSGEQREEEKAKEPQSSMLSDMSSEGPIIVNGDKIEYFRDINVVTIEGNVEIIKGNSVLTCDKATVNTLTNDAHAEGNVILKDRKGLIKARSCDYNFKSQAGIAFDADADYKPYYGKGKIVRKVSENEIEIKNGYMTTCDRGSPHYRIQSRRMEIFPDDKVTTRAMTFRVANTPILYLPKFTQNLKDDRMHVQVTPGKSKDWGLFILTAWRYDLLNNSAGRIHLDYRERRELAWGIDNFYDTKVAGKGFVKTYYTHERKLGRRRIYKYPQIVTPEKSTKEKERYRIQWRHKWDVDKNTYWLAEYHKVNDVNFIKDYFFREYEKKEAAVNSSYILLSHTLPDSSILSMLNQKRTNRIFSETEMLPEIKWEKPATKLFDFGSRAEIAQDGSQGAAGSVTSLYFNNSWTYLNFNTKTAAPSEDDDSNQKIENYTRLSLPFKFLFLEFNPSAGTRESYYKRIAGRDAGIFREVWDSGIDVTTRFYRIFDVDADFLGMEYNMLRHIISPSVRYAYTHPPTAASSKLIDLGSQSESNQMDFSLENKLQTKRKNKTVDFLRFIANNNYSFNIEGRRRSLGDNITFDLEMLPYDWMSFESDAKFDRRKRHFTFANFDLKASGKDISFGGGYRYERKSSSQMTGEILFNLIKGWSFKVYQRLQFKGNSLVKEQDYSLSKELHCWILDIKYNVLRERGETIWLALRLKAFPEMSIDYGQIYHEPKPGSQGYRNE